MFFIRIILAVLAYSPMVALAAPHALAKAYVGSFTSPKSLTDLAPVGKLYSGIWSNFPVMKTWVGFDDMVSSFGHRKPPSPSRTSMFPWRFGWNH